MVLHHWPRCQFALNPIVVLRKAQEFECCLQIADTRMLEKHSSRNLVCATRLGARIKFRFDVRTIVTIVVNINSSNTRSPSQPELSVSVSSSLSSTPDSGSLNRAVP